MRFSREIIAAGVRNPVFANLLMVCILAGGFLSTRQMIREAYPELSVNYVEIIVAWPGASTEDVERSICIPIEEAMVGIDGLTEISSAANEDFGTVYLELHSISGDMDAVLREALDRVEQVTSFPPESEKPIIRELIIRSEVISVAIYGDATERTLKEFARDTKRDLLANSAISQVSLSGVREEEIIIEISEETLRAYSLTFSDVMTAIARSSLDLPAGTIRTSEEEVTLRVSGQRLAAMEYEDLVVIERPDALVHLGDIADVREGFAEGTSNGRFNEQGAVVVAVFKTPYQDTTEIARIVRNYVEDRQATLPERVKMSVWADNSHDVTSRIDMLVSNGIAGIILVVVSLALFLELRLAVWVAVGIPISFAGALIIMNFCGETINMISLFALIMVSGIIVDDAIVIAESIHARRKAGDIPELASIDGAHRVALPVLGSSLTTIITFIPLMFVVGAMGKLIHVLPVVVIAAIASSALEAFGILPAHLHRRTPVGLKEKTKGPGKLRLRIDSAVETFITGWYRPVYRLTLRYRAVTVSLAVACLLFVFGLVAGERTGFVFYPKEDGRILRARVRYPEGTPLSVSEETLRRIEQAALALNNDPELVPARPGTLVQQVYSVAGEFADFLPVRGSNLCEVRIELMPAEDRRINEEMIIDSWRNNIGPIHDAILFTIARQDVGPIDRSIEIRLLGSSLQDMSEASQRLQTKLREFEGVTEVYNDLIPGKRELKVKLRSAARALGLALDDVATQLRQGFFGGEAVRVRRGRDEVIVRVRYPEKERQSIFSLYGKNFRTPLGEEIPFHEAVEVEWATGYARVMHQDGLRRVRTNAEVDERRANAEQIIRSLETEFLPGLVNDYNDMRYSFGGSRHEMDVSLGSLSAGFKMAMIAVYALLAGMLRSYVQPLVILSAVPFGIIGAVFGHVVLGYDLTLMSMFGVVALSGVVVNDSLVLLDRVNVSIREGQSVEEAVMGAGELRFRAVTLTSLTTVVGLTPLLLERSTQAYTVMPMAISLVFGIAFATVLTLVVVPSLYLVVNDVRRFIRFLRYGGEYPRAELVEEAYRDRTVAGK